MKRIVRRLFIILLVLIVIVGGSFVNEVFLQSPKQDAKPVEITIESGDSVNTISARLERAHLVTHPRFFKWFVKLSQTQSRLQAGTFLLTPGTSIASLVLLLSNVQTSEVQVTIPEGFTNEQIKTKMIETISNFDQVAWNAQTKNLEGSLFPDTYRFSKTVTIAEIVQKMQSTLDRRMAENKIDFETCDKYDPSMGYVSPFRCSRSDILILASILEKEVQSPEDMKHVAGILYNRLSIGMPLQVDSTLTYVTQKTSANLTTTDLKSASPYNTYTHKGLPPSPICNPGMNAIVAALHPTQTKDLYFLTTNDGKTIYAKTHDEHVANKQKYLK